MGDGDENRSQTGWSNERREVIHREARTAIEAQQATLDDIDDKAMRTVRITVLILGVFASAIRLAALNVEDVNNLAAAAGGISLVLSVVAGVFTYTQSSLAVAPDREYIDQLSAGRFTDETWDENLIETLGEWIEENTAIISFNATTLLVTQILFVLGVVLVLASVVF
jgi:hypothetical protein